VTPSAFNELFQWLAVGALLILVFAVYRQLGLMLADRPAYLAHSFGPKVGDRLDGELATALAKRPLAPWNLVVFAQENCPACEQFFSQITDWSEAELTGVRLTVAFKGNIQQSVDLKTQLPDAEVISLESVLGPKEMWQGEKIPAYPFAILLSDDGTVRAKQVGSNAEAVRHLIGEGLNREEVTT
jgi:hypothetical protein